MQAARGASLSSSGKSTGPSAVHWILFVSTASTFYVVDQITKAWALAALADDPVPVIGDWFTLRLVFNPGAAFSAGTEYTIVFTFLAIVAVGVVLFLSRKVASRVWALGLGLLLAGVAGNLTDRLLRDPEPMYGHVIDFLSFGSFPVFNIADICINVAAAVIILQSLRGIALDGTKESGGRAAAPSEESP